MYYVTTYPNDGFTYQASNIVLADHSDAAYLNARKACSRAGEHIMISENVPVPNINGTLLTIFQIIKFVMYSADESQLTGILVCTKERAPLHQTYIS